ncbi:hypothetical protein [Mesomycoplasma bovoculi]|uniref:PQ loop repeat protein n=1 Tax=Mesomycoplasma bovoculi M165/69 TaxID=743966 RepID=W5USV9_9BACT|nr:hypothetical protein [Mesomycoplasma bovoculi]AHH45217.1 hypothetical protein MYB_01030 [Mesomycoplasma bovoculi M165/69]
MNSTIQAIGWLASFTTAILGIPMVVNTYKNREIKSASIISWWIYFIGVFLYLIVGWQSKTDQIVITELFNGIITFLFVILFSFYLKSRKISKEFKFANIVFSLAMITTIIAIVILHFAGVTITIPDAGAEVLSILAASFINFAFLPQTIIVIKQKKLIHMPFFFVHDLTLLNILWLVFLGANIDLPGFKALLALQVLGLLISLVQGVFYYIQVFDKKLNPSRKIVWI